MNQRDTFTIPITCSHCANLGGVVWEENRYNETSGPQRRLVSIHGAFHHETGRTSSGDPVIVCTLCDQIQPD